ncbi:hypothetical protein TorRG33x02_064190, partial [Trema orientale]
GRRKARNHCIWPRFGRNFVAFFLTAWSAIGGMASSGKGESTPARFEWWVNASGEFWRCIRKKVEEEEDAWERRERLGNFWGFWEFWGKCDTCDIWADDPSSQNGIMAHVSNFSFNLVLKNLSLTPTLKISFTLVRN